MLSDWVTPLWQLMSCQQDVILHLMTVQKQWFCRVIRQQGYNWGTWNMWRCWGSVQPCLTWSHIQSRNLIFFIAPSLTLISYKCLFHNLVCIICCFCIINMVLIFYVLMSNVFYQFKVILKVSFEVCSHQWIDIIYFTLSPFISFGVGNKFYLLFYLFILIT